jgi:pimeloyl-ACP methyl ester carboxylesterase
MDCARLLRKLGVERAHVLGHSYGGVIALQLAQDAPELVHSLTLLEPALMLLVPSGQAMMVQMAPIIEMYQRGEKESSMAAFIQGISRPNAREIIDAEIPGGYDEALRMADLFFQVEMPALQAWSFGQDQAARIRQPVLSVIGEETVPPFVEVHDLLRRLLPQMEEATISGATHIHDIEKPGATADVVARFLSLHPL